MTSDIKSSDNNIIFSCRSCAIIICDSKILLQKRVKDKFWALPGGKIKYGESSLETIYRELYEELQIDNIAGTKLVDVNEYFFTLDEQFFHQYIFTYIVSLLDYKIIENSISNKKSIDGLIFQWFDLEKMNWDTIKPNYLKEQISKEKVRKLNRIIREV